jgi:hypothetical protein
MAQVRSRNWCFTLNNYTAEEVEACRKEGGLAKYMVFGYETGKLETPHLQGYIQYKTMRSFKQQKQFLERAHWDPARGDGGANKKYCSKDGNFEEFGEPPKTQQEKGNDRWKRVIEEAEAGMFDEIKTRESHLWINCSKKLKAMRQLPKEKLNYKETPHEFWHGPTGTYKSSEFWERYPDGYPKDTNKWWDDYEGQEVLIEECDPETMKYLASKMKKWVDRFPFLGETKGGSIRIRPPKIVMISNYTLRECFPNDQDYYAMERRVTVREFTLPEPDAPPRPWYHTYPQNE